MECIGDAKKDKEAWSKEDEVIYKHLGYSYDKFRSKPLIRYLMTGAGKGGSTAVSEWESWAENILGSSIADVTVKDAQWVEAQTRNLETAVKRAVFKDGSGLKQFLIKVATLPADMFNYHGLGHVHEKIAEADQVKAQRRAGLSQKLKAIQDAVHEITGTSVKEASRIFRDVNTDVEQKFADFQLKKKGGNKVEIEIARKAHQEAVRRFEELTGDKSTANRSARVIRLIAETLDGQISEKQLRAKLGSDAEFGTLKRVIDKTKELTSEFSKLFNESSLKFRDMLAYELEAKMTKEDALEAATQITQYVPEEMYYPNRNLLTLYQRVEGIVKAKEIIAKEQGDSFIEQLNTLIGSERSAHANHRKGKSSMINYNMFDVLDVYGKEVYDHTHAADVGQIASTFERRLMNLDVIRNSAGKNTQEVKYANSVRRLLMAQMNQIFDKKAATFADNTLATLSAYQVFSKLTNPSTSLNNRVEGIMQYLAHTGLTRVNNVKRLQKTYKKEISDALIEAHTEFTVENLTDPAWNPANNAALRSMLSEHDLVDAETLRGLELNGAMGLMRKGMSKLAGKGMSLMLWEKAENANRQEAFMMGAAEGAHFMEGKWRDRILQGGITQHLIDTYTLSTKLVNEAKSAKGKQAKNDARTKLYEELRNKYIIRQGYRSMFQTQFQYSESSRNFMDMNAKTSWITMFQHYPRSLASTVLWAMNDVKSLYQTGGIGALKGEITARKFAENKEGTMNKIRDGLAINHRLNHVLTLGGISMLRNIIRMNTGMVAFNLLSHPFAEIMSDLYNYFVDDEPMGKRDKAWELLYGRNQPIRRVTGPLVGTVLDAASVPAKEFLQAMDGIGMATVEAGVRDGSMVEYLSTALGLAGARPSDRALTDNGRKDYNSAFGVAKDYALHSFSIYGKGQAWVNALVKRNPHEISLTSLRMIGVRPDWKVINQAKDDNFARDVRP